jgi:hypothetical protein
MKAIFQLTPSESKRLIAKAVVRLSQVKEAWKKGYVVVAGGITTSFVMEELLARAIEKGRCTAGISIKGILCVTSAQDRLAPGQLIDSGIGSEPTKSEAFQALVFQKGVPVRMTMKEAFEDFHRETVMIKGGNALDHEGNVGIAMAGFNGGTIGEALGYVYANGISLIVPIGLEKLIPSVKEAASVTGAKTFDHAIGSSIGIMPLSNIILVHEIKALGVLTGVKATHVASGGVSGSEGAVVLVAEGDKAAVEETVRLVHSIKGEPPIKARKGRCSECSYFCTFAGKEESELPCYLRSS